MALWTAAAIPELNEAYAVPRWCPELLVIGLDGGDDGLGFDRAASTDPEQCPVVRIGVGNLDRRDFVQVAPSFAAWRLLEFRIRHWLTRRLTPTQRNARAWCGKLNSRRAD